MKNIIIKKSNLQGEGVFANIDLKKGDIVIKWHPKRLIDKKDMRKLSKYEQNHTSYTGKGKWVLMGIPERYVNHSCNPNTYFKDNQDVALRKIKKGEEITTDYSVNGIDNWKMECNCNSKKCRKTIYGNFLKLPKKLQVKYKPYLADWFKEENKIKW
jgi:SET domain-containing protein